MPDVIAHLDAAIEALESIGETRYDQTVAVAFNNVDAARATLTDEAIVVETDAIRPILTYVEEEVTNRNHLRDTDLAKSTEELRDRFGGRSEP